MLGCRSALAAKLSDDGIILSSWRPCPNSRMSVRAMTSERGGYGGGFAIRPDYVDADFVRDYCEDKSSNDTSDLEAIANANSHDDRDTGGL